MAKNEILRARISTKTKADFERLAKSLDKSSTDVLLELVEKFITDNSGKANTLIRVNMSVDFIVPDYVPQGNGQTLDQVLEDWFGVFANRAHATRDTCEVGGGKRILSWQVIDRI